MAQIFVVQTFRQKGRRLVADQPQQAKSEQAAKLLAERFIETRSGVIAYSQQVDVETDSYDDPIIIFKHGSIPPEIDE